MNYIQFLTTILIAIITFVLQKTLSNVVAGTLLRISKPFKHDDRIVVMQNRNLLTSGWVIKVGILSTTIKTYEKQFVTIPNDQLLNNCIVINQSKNIKQNYTQTISFSLDSDVDDIHNIILQTVLEHPETHNTKENTDIVTRIDNGKLLVTYNVRTHEGVDQSFRVCTEITEQLLKRLVDFPKIKLA